MSNSVNQSCQSPYCEWRHVRGGGREGRGTVVMQYLSVEGESPFGFASLIWPSATDAGIAGCSLRMGKMAGLNHLIAEMNKSHNNLSEHPYPVSYQKRLQFSSL